MSSLVREGIERGPKGCPEDSCRHVGWPSVPLGGGLVSLVDVEWGRPKGLPCETLGTPRRILKCENTCKLDVTKKLIEDSVRRRVEIGD